VDTCPQPTECSADNSAERPTIWREPKLALSAMALGANPPKLA
jgi:hypothetical protein